jgi:CheY-like chemotaxis protein
VNAQVAPAPAASPSRTPLSRSKQRILVVDDNQDSALLLSEVLEDHGHQVRTANDGPTALQVAKEFLPTLAILDSGLPVMDGYELAHRLRLEPAHAALRLIALTGYGQPSDRERSRQAGFVHHLAKPVSADLLTTLVDELK